MFYCPELGRFLSRDMIIRPGENPYTYVRNDPLTYVDPLGLWEEGGHFYTTYMVAIAAGVDRETAYELAYYSQLPDEIGEMDAMHAILDWGDFSSIPISERDAFRAGVAEVLHSLHGGDVDKRRGCLSGLLKNWKAHGLTPWQRGMIVHAFGDAFAHTYTESGTVKAFRVPWGHGHRNVADYVGASDRLATQIFGGRSPDKIGQNLDTYQQYVNALFEAFGGNLKDDAQVRMRDQIKDNAVKTYKDPPKDENQSMEDYARDWPFGLPGEYRPHKRVSPHTRQGKLPVKGPLPTLTDVAKLLDLIKKECGCK